MAELSISIVLYKNDAEQLQQLLKSIALTRLDYTIHLVDNSPTDNLKNKLAEYLINENVHYFFNGKNLGYGSGHNVAIKETINSSKYHLVVNPDVRFDDKVLDQLFEYMNANDDIGLVVPKVLYSNGELQYVCKLIPTPINLFLRLLPRKFFKSYNDYFELRFTGYNKIMNIPYMHGCFMFLRCSTLKEVGLFDERFFMYPEDIDLTRRIHKKYKTIFYPVVHIYHEHAKSSFKSFHMFKIHLSNLFKYFNKWGWIFDAERKKVNKQTLENLKAL